jgi:hypothetical protein
MQIFHAWGFRSTPRSRRLLCRTRLDWSERRYHVAGTSGMALARHAINAGRVTRDAKQAGVHVTPQGTAALRDCIRAGFVETLPPDR